MTTSPAEKPPAARASHLARGTVAYDQTGTPFHSLTWTSPDGLRLHARDYGPETSQHLPLICLPGLTRNARDFEPVAAHLASQGMRVIAVDSRGRGGSAWDPRPQNYNVMVELDDVHGLLDLLELSRVNVMGTSRGGVLMMISALKRPDLFEKAILNDIGPKVELEGLLKIKAQIGRDLGALTWEKATFALSVSQGSLFPRLEPAAWERYARRLWRDVNGTPVPDYDPALRATTASLTPETQLPENWDGFLALTRRPTLVLRGSLSDILSVDTLNEMRKRAPGLHVHEVIDEAHVPLLEDAPTLDAITRFLMTA